MEHSQTVKEVNEGNDNDAIFSFDPEFGNNIGFLSLPDKDVDGRSMVSFNLDEEDGMLGRRSSRFGARSRRPSVFSTVTGGEFSKTLCMLGILVLFILIFAILLVVYNWWGNI